MNSIIGDAIGGFNANLKEQKAVGDANVTVVLFDHEYKVLYDRVPIERVPDMTEKTYVPRGQTALLDAIGRTVSTMRNRFHEECQHCRLTKVSVVIITDGIENASREFARQQICDMLEHQQKKHDWQVLYLAANQDAITEGALLGVAAINAVNFAPTGKGVRRAYATSSGHLRSYRTSK